MSGPRIFESNPLGTDFAIASGREPIRAGTWMESLSMPGILSELGASVMAAVAVIMHANRPRELRPIHRDRGYRSSRAAQTWFLWWFHCNIACSVERSAPIGRGYCASSAGKGENGGIAQPGCRKWPLYNIILRYAGPAFTGKNAPPFCASTACCAG